MEAFVGSVIRGCLTRELEFTGFGEKVAAHAAAEIY